MGIRNVFLLLTGTFVIMLFGGASCGGPSPILEDPPNQQPSINIGLVLSDYSLVLTQGGKASVTISVSADRDVNLSYGSLPTGVTATFSENPTNSSSTLSFSAADDTQIGQFDVFLEGQSGNTTELETLSLEIRKKVNSNSALEVSFSGLPGPWQTGGYAIVEGPNQYRQAIFEDQKLSNLESGQYVLTVPDLPLCDENYTDNLPQISIFLEENSVKPVRIDYVGLSKFPLDSQLKPQGFKADISTSHSVSFVIGEIYFVYEDNHLIAFGCESWNYPIQSISLMKGYARDYFVASKETIGTGSFKIFEGSNEYIYGSVLIENKENLENIFVEIMVDAFGSQVPIIEQIVEEDKDPKDWYGAQITIYNDTSNLPESALSDLSDLEIYGPLDDFDYGFDIRIKPLEYKQLSNLYSYDFLVKSTHGRNFVNCDTEIPIRYMLSVDDQLTNIVKVRRTDDPNRIVVVTYIKNGTNDNRQDACLINVSESPRDYDFASGVYRSRGFVTGNNSEAGVESNEPTFPDGLGGASVWWQLDGVGGTVKLDTFSNVGFDTNIAVYKKKYIESDLYTLELVSSNNDAYIGTLFSELSFEAERNDDYLIMVDGLNGETGDIKLNWSLVSPIN